MREIKTVIVELEYPRDDCLRDCSDEYYGIGRELIRCKDCRYFGRRKDSGYYTCGRKQGCVDTIPEGFCGWAVRNGKDVE